MRAASWRPRQSWAANSNKPKRAGKTCAIMCRAFCRHRTGKERLLLRQHYACNILDMHQCAMVSSKRCQFEFGCLPGEGVGVGAE